MNILITGGSRGIGAAAVRLFCARGDSVWFLYEKRHEQAQALSRETGAAQSAAMWRTSRQFLPRFLSCRRSMG